MTPAVAGRAPCQGRASRGGRHGAARTLGAAPLAALVIASACVTAPERVVKPRVLVHTDRAPSGVCEARVKAEVVEGPVPGGVVRLADVTTTATEPRVPLKVHERAARERAKAYCADGVSVLRAVEARGGVDETTMVFWRNLKKGERLRNKARAPVDAGVADVDAGDAGDVDSGA